MQVQYDAAVDPAIAAFKVKGHSEVAGQANVLVFPSLNSGNVSYKVQLLPSMHAVSTCSHCYHEEAVKAASLVEEEEEQDQTTQN